MIYRLPQSFTEPDESFTYLVNGMSYPIRKELRNGKPYWFLRKMRGGQKVAVYLGPVGSLSVEILTNAVADAEMQFVAGGNG